MLKLPVPGFLVISAPAKTAREQDLAVLVDLDQAAALQLG
jgi:hypothetical protein